MDCQVANQNTSTIIEEIEQRILQYGYFLHILHCQLKIELMISYNHLLVQVQFKKCTMIAFIQYVLRYCDE